MTSRLRQALTPTPSRSTGRGRGGRSASHRPDAVKVLDASNEDLPARNGRRRVTLLAQLVLADQLVLRPRVDHERLARVAGEVQLAVRARHGRGAVVAAELFLPQHLARPRLEAGGEAA